MSLNCSCGAYAASGSNVFAEPARGARRPPSATRAAITSSTATAAIATGTVGKRRSGAAGAAKRAPRPGDSASTGEGGGGTGSGMAAPIVVRQASAMQPFLPRSDAASGSAPHSYGSLDANEARFTFCRKSGPAISTITHISCSRERMRSPMRSPSVSSRTAKRASWPSAPAGGKLA